ncbi:hypothetical protein [Sphingosinicella terrae]|uniref:hypothetical protein n=1 Tax=Sphingosinicella terrae TaxID=2172047 RepID=UPI0013B3CCDE|nr:hypothetical protein [Sphingosinicella terrae]
MADMESLLIALFVATAPAAVPAEDGDPAALDLRCFRLMAALSDEEDPRLRSMGRVAAQYFLGRIDAAAPGFDVANAGADAGGDRARLLRRCGEVMSRGGRDFRAIGEALAPTGGPAI